MLAAQPRQRRGRRPQHGKAAGLGRAGEGRRQVLRQPHRLVERAAAHHGVDERQERRIPQPLAVLDLALEERRVILAAGQAHAVVRRVERLHDRLAGLLAAPRAPRHLREQLEGALAGTEIRQAETDVGRHHADERHARKVVPLGNHLRPHQHVELAGREPGEDGGERATLPHRVAVHPPHARRREERRDLLLYLLGAETGMLQVGGGALATRLGHGHGVVAVVAARAPAVPRGVHGERDAAVGALEGVAALAAEHGGGVAAAVEQHQHLFPPRQPLFDRRRERAADHDVRPLRGVLLAHVHHAHLREGTVEHAPGQHDLGVLAGLGVLIALHRGRGRAEHDQGALFLRAHDRHVTTVIARRLLLLVRRVVLFVHDDQSETLERREHRGSGADDDVHVAAADALPLIVTLAVRERAVLNRHALGEGSPHQRRHRRREGNLGDEQQHLPAGVAHRARHAQVHLGLAAPGHAVQQRHLEAAGAGERDERLAHLGLFRRRRPRGVVGDGLERRTSEGVALVGSIARRDELSRNQAREHGRRHPAFAQLLERQPGGTGQRLQRGPLFGGEAGALRWRRARAGALFERGHAVRRQRHQLPRLVARRPGLGARRQRHPNGVADAGHVVVGHPGAQLDDRGRQERLLVDDFLDVPGLDFGPRRRGRADDAASHEAAAHRHTHPDTDGRRRPPLGHAIGQRIELWNGDGYGNETHGGRRPVIRTVSARPGLKTRPYGRRRATRGRASCLPTPRACSTGSAAGRPGDRSGSGSRRGSGTRGHGCA